MHIKNQVCSMSVQLWHAKRIPWTESARNENDRKSEREGEKYKEITHALQQMVYNFFFYNFEVS